ncbi:unnamed protein product [Pleuronectes platessa]|uniref:Uncharacterized protein n=1 Tax=Pleuronectes platessa TaxID=8262 RepID=A0A9N7YH25_PLEPL|nr:unnamed protein product [Pleuronectes platessa]
MAWVARCITLPPDVPLSQWCGPINAPLLKGSANSQPWLRTLVKLCPARMKETSEENSAPGKKKLESLTPVMGEDAPTDVKVPFSKASNPLNLLGGRQQQQ